MLWVISFLVSMVLSWANIYFTLLVAEGIHDFRRCVKESPSGGYYQKFSFAQYCALHFLKYEVSIEKLPQGGYNVYPYKRE